MADYRRSTTTGACYFFTVVSNRRQPLLCQDNIRNALHHAIKTTQQSMPFTIEAWVLMPDHLHCIWSLPPGDNDYSKRWALIKRAVGQACKPINQQRTSCENKRHESGIWQRRFWEHQIRDQTDFNRHMDYIHYNPVKHGLCQQPTQWRWSTIHRLIKSGFYPQNWCCPIAGQNEHNSSQFGE